MSAGQDEFKPELRERARVAVLLSGSGRTLENLVGAIARGQLPLEIVHVVSSKSGVRGIDVAERAGIPVTVIEPGGYDSVHQFSQAIYRAIDPAEPDLILMAGFLRRLAVVPFWEGRILNIHPALLPESGIGGQGYYGERVHRAVLESGATESGATVHVVDNQYDHGPVVMKATVPVLPGDTPDTLGARVFAAECDLYPEAIRRYLGEHPELLAGS